MKEYGLAAGIKRASDRCLLTFVDCLDRIHARKDRGEFQRIGRSSSLRGTSVMSETASPEIDAPAGQRFQFSLWTMLVLVTGLSVIFSLVAWRASLGSMIAIPIVSIWWTIAAIRAGRRRLAYYLITPAMGAIICLLLSTPLTPATMGMVGDYTWRPFGLHAWISVLSMCLATLATAAILRRRIRVRFANRLAMTGIACVYLAALIYPIVFFPITLTVGGPAMRGLLLGSYSPSLPGMAVIATIVSPVVATVSFHVAGPAGIAFCFILRCIDPPENDLNETERRLVRIVDELQAEGSKMITHADVLSRAKGNVETLPSHLSHLRQLGILQWDGDTGLRHKT